MLPARGTVARLLAPRETSAVHASDGTITISSLRPDSGAGERRRSVIEQTSEARILRPTRNPNIAPPLQGDTISAFRRRLQR